VLSRTGPLVKRSEAAPNAEPQASDEALVLEPTTPATPTLHSERPSVGEVVSHPFKSLFMLVALLTDRRVSFVRKLVFAVPITLLVLGLLIPETVFGLLSGIVAPVIGLVLDVPIDAAVDWVGIALLAVALLAVFPKQIVAQYHAQLFHHAKKASR